MRTKAAPALKTSYVIFEQSDLDQGQDSGLDRMKIQQRLHVYPSARGFGAGLVSADQQRKVSGCVSGVVFAPGLTPASRHTQNRSCQ